VSKQVLSHQRCFREHCEQNCDGKSVIGAGGSRTRISQLYRVPASRALAICLLAKPLGEADRSCPERAPGPGAQPTGWPLNRLRKSSASRSTHLSYSPSQSRSGIGRPALYVNDIPSDEAVGSGTLRCEPLMTRRWITITMAACTKEDVEVSRSLQPVSNSGRSTDDLILKQI
jgi:hypothetical protein